MNNKISWDTCHAWTGGVPHAPALLGLGGPTLSFCRELDCERDGAAPMPSVKW